MTKTDSFNIALRQLKIFKSFNFIALIFTILLLCVIFLNIMFFDAELNLEINDFASSSNYVTVRIRQFLYTLLFGHVQGIFPFLYVYLVQTSFPTPQQFKFLKPINLGFQITESFLIFISMHVKLISKVAGKFNPAFDGLFNKYLVRTAALFVINNLISTTVQILLFQYSFDYESNVNRYVMYFGAIGSFLLIYVINVFVFSVLRTNTEIMKCKNYVQQVFICAFIGSLLAGFIDLIIFVFSKLNKWIISLKFKVALPQFSQQNAKSFGFSGFAFTLSLISDYILYLSSHELKLKRAQNSRNCERKPKSFSNLSKAALKQINEAASSVKYFIQDRGQYLICQLIVLMFIINQYLSDFVTLATFLMSGRLSSSNEKLLKTISLILALVLLLIYIGLICLQVKFKSKLLGFFTYACGFFALPAILSVEIIKNLLMDIVSCDLQDYLEYLIVNFFVPFTSFISFIQVIPLLFPSFTIQKHVDFNEQLKKTKIQETMMLNRQQQQIGVHTEQEIQQQIECLDKQFANIDFKYIYKQAKLSFACDNDAEPRKIFQLLERKWWMKLLGIYLEKRDDVISVAFKGAQSVLTFEGFGIIFGTIDWILLSFSPFIGYVHRDVLHNQQSFGSVNSFLKLRASLALKLLTSSKDFSKYEIQVSGLHSGAVSATLFCSMLHHLNPHLIIKCVGFNMPPLISQSLVNSVQQSIAYYRCFRIGFDGKLFASAVLSNQLLWPSNICLGLHYGERIDEFKSNFAVLSAGGSMADAFEAVRAKLDKVEAGEKEVVDDKNLEQVVFGLFFGKKKYQQSGNSQNGEDAETKDQNGTIVVANEPENRASKSLEKRNSEQLGADLKE